MSWKEQGLIRLFIVRRSQGIIWILSLLIFLSIRLIIGRVVNSEFVLINFLIKKKKKKYLVFLLSKTLFLKNT